MQTLFTIVVLLYYVSLLAELYWLAVPSAVSSYNIFKNKKKSRFYFIILDVLAVIAFILPVLTIGFSFIGFNLMLLNHQTWLIGISIFVIIVGRIFTFWGTVNIRKHLKKQNITVLESGIFSISRHPIATGLIISLIGFNLAYLNWVLFLLSITFVININQKILLEEALLQQQHPTEYQQYKQQSRRFL